MSIVIICVLCFPSEVRPNNFPSIDTIIVQKAGKLIMINEKGIELKTLSIKRKVFDFVWVNSDLLVYTSLNKKNLNVYKYDMQKNTSSKIAELLPKKKNTNFWGNFARDDYGMELSGDYLLIPCDIECILGCGGSSKYLINLKTKSVTYLSWEKDSKKLEELYLKIKTQRYTQIQSQVLNSISLGTDYELYYSTENEYKRITNTPYPKLIAPGIKCIRFDISPKADKVIFQTVEEGGEEYFGRKYLVNLDGTDQQMIGPFNNSISVFASCSSGFSYMIEYETDSNWKTIIKLKAIIKTNTPITIMSDFDNAKLCEGNNWGYKKFNLIRFIDDQ